MAIAAQVGPAQAPAVGPIALGAGGLAPRRTRNFASRPPADRRPVSGPAAGPPRAQAALNRLFDGLVRRGAERVVVNKQ